MIMVAKTGWLTLMRVRNKGSILENVDKAAGGEFRQRRSDDEIARRQTRDDANEIVAPFAAGLDFGAFDPPLDDAQDICAVAVLKDRIRRQRKGGLGLGGHDPASSEHAAQQRPVIVGDADKDRER